MAEAGSVRLAQVIPLGGAAARQGGDWRNGVEMAVQALLAAGGPGFQVYTYDLMSPAVGGRSSLARALDGDVAALLAVAPPGAILPVLERGVPVIVPGAAWMVATPPAVPPVLASPGPLARLRRFLPWLREGLGLRRFALLGGQAEGERPVRAAFRMQAAAAGIEVVADRAVPPHVPAGVEIAALLRTDPEAVFLDAPLAEAARLLVALRERAPDLPVAGAGVLAEPALLEAAGPAARQIVAHVAASAEVPALAGFAARFEAMFKSRPGALAIDGYVAVMALRAGLAAVARGEAPSLPAALRDLRTGAEETLLATRWAASGEPARDSFVARIPSPGAIEWLTLSV